MADSGWTNDAVDDLQIPSGGPGPGQDGVFIGSDLLALYFPELLNFVSAITAAVVWQRGDYPSYNNTVPEARYYFLAIEGEGTPSNTRAFTIGAGVDNKAGTITPTTILRMPLAFDATLDPNPAVTNRHFMDQHIELEWPLLASSAGAGGGGKGIMRTLDDFIEYYTRGHTGPNVFESPTLINGFVNSVTAGPQDPVGIQCTLDAAGNFHIQGTVRTPPSGAVTFLSMANIASLFSPQVLPKYRHYFMGFYAGASRLPVMVFVTPDGDIELIDINGTGVGNNIDIWFSTTYAIRPILTV